MTIPLDESLKAIHLLMIYYRKAFHADHVYMDILDAECIIRTHMKTGRPLSIYEIQSRGLYPKFSSIHKAYKRVFISSELLIPEDDRLMMYVFMCSLHMKLLPVDGLDSYRMN